MCRRNCLHGGCCLCFGLGIMVGAWLDSWFWCSFGALALCIFGLWLAGRR